jgi:hypothetical protein
VLLSAALLALSFTPIAASPAVPAGAAIRSLPAWKVHMAALQALHLQSTAHLTLRNVQWSMQCEYASLPHPDKRPHIHTR